LITYATGEKDLAVGNHAAHTKKKYEGRISLNEKIFFTTLVPVK